MCIIYGFLMAKVHVNRIDEATVEALRKEPVDFKDRDGLVEDAIRQGLEAVDWKAKVPEGSKVLLKVNGCHYRFMPALVTVPAVAAKFTEVMLERAESVVVCESDLQRWDADVVLKNVGYKKVIERVGGTVLNLSKAPMREYDIDGELFTKRQFPTIFADADVFITMPIIKTHKLWYISLGLKNQFGCIPESDRIRYMNKLPALVSDINALLKPSISFIDGTFGLEGDGPIAGIPKRMGVFLTADNIVAGDVVGGKIMALDPMESPLITHALDRGLGPGNMKDIKLYGLPLEKVAKRFKPPSNDIVSRGERWVRKHPKLANVVYRSALFNVVKRLAWGIRGASGYKHQYETDIIESGVWDDYDYSHLFEVKPGEG